MRKPKKSCCLSKPRCNRCPVRMLAEGRLPEGYAVKRRKLVKLETVAGKKHSKKHSKKQGKKQGKKRGKGLERPKAA